MKLSLLMALLVIGVAAALGEVDDHPVNPNPAIENIADPTIREDFQGDEQRWGGYGGWGRPWGGYGGWGRPWGGYGGWGRPWGYGYGRPWYG